MDTLKTEKTNNYSTFKFWDSNREIRPKNVNRLKKNILAMDLTATRPILVNRNFYIIDGQHRFQACKELGLPIYYTVVDIPDNDINNYIVMLNTGQKNWGLPDYMRHYCNLKYQNYVALQEFMDYHNISEVYLASAFFLFADCSWSGKETARFKAGELSSKWEGADEIMQIINSLPLQHRMQRAFVSALKRAYKEYTGKEFKKLLSKIIKVPAMVNVSDYMIAFNNIINKRA